VRKKRKIYQRTKRLRNEEERSLYLRYSDCVKEFKKKIMQQKENDWREFVRKGIEIRVQGVQREEKDGYDECDECR